jgi:ferredoxin--NADP+ reductase
MGPTGNIISPVARIATAKKSMPIGIRNCAPDLLDCVWRSRERDGKSPTLARLSLVFVIESASCFTKAAYGKTKRMSAFHREKVLSVRHWTDTLFSFRATRNSGFRFQNGQFAMIGLEVDGRPLLRAYSMASANHEEELEFFSIKVADGPLTSRLQKIQEGDTILVGRKATGTLVADNLLAGERLLLLSTGTGLAPFASLIKDPDVYERFDSIVLVHGCRQVSELAYGEELVAKLRDDELFGPLLAEKLVYYPTVTREPFRNRGRITDLITSRQLFDDIGQAPLNIEADRIMMCGSPAMLEELRTMFEARGFAEGSTSEPGHFVIEKAFVER